MFKRILSTLLVLVTLLSFLPPKAAAQENAPQVAGDVTVEGTNSFGTLLANTVQNDPQTQSETQPNRICDLQFNGSLATVEYTSVQAARLVVAVYTEDGSKMLGSGTREVSPEDTLADVEIEIGTMPKYYSAAAYLLDIQTNDPLSPEFRTQLYTKTVQDIKNSTVADYDPERVLNLDDDNTTNFAVFGENTILVREDSPVQITGGDGVYTVTNADERFLAMQPGDSFAVRQEDGDYLIVKAERVSVKGDTVTIYEDVDADIGDFFDVIKIEAYSNPDTATFDDSEMSDGVREISRDEFYSDYDTANYALEGDLIESVEKTYEISDYFGNPKVYVKGKVGVDLIGSVHYYFGGIYWHISVKLDVSLFGNIKVEGKVAPPPLTLGEIKFPLCDGVNYVTRLQFVVEATAALSWTYSLSFALGRAWDSYTPDGYDIGSPAKLNSKQEVVGKIFVGLKLSAGVNFIDSRVAEVSLEGKRGLEFEAKVAETPGDKPTEIHECVLCFDGTIYDVATCTIVLSFAGSHLQFKHILAETKTKLGIFYYSKTWDEFGLFKKCPHIKYLTAFTVVDENGLPIKDAKIRLFDGPNGTGTEITKVYRKDAKGTVVQTAIPHTADDGTISIFLDPSNYSATAVKDDISETIDLQVLQQANKERIILADFGDDAGLFLSETDIEMNIDDSAKDLSVLFGDKDRNIDVSKACQWKVSDDKVVSVHSGKLEPLGNGTATVTASYSRKGKTYTAKCNVKVKGSPGIASGKCGDNLKWRISEDKTLVIYGHGDMWDYSIKQVGDKWVSMAPWLDYNPQKLILRSGITKIGLQAFMDCTSLTGELTIPEGVRRIETNAFLKCSGLSGQLTLPESLRIIEASAFGECSGFTGQLKLPEGLTIIGGSAFHDCNGFDGELILPPNLNVLGGGAFSHCSGFTGDLIIPEGIQSIEDHTFGRCSGFTGKLVLPSTATNVGSGAFFDCNFTGTLNIPDGVTTIGDMAFWSCDGFTGNLIIPESVTSIGEGAFGSCAFSGDLVIPGSVKTIGRGAFQICKNFDGDLIISAGVKEIGNEAFRWCDGFTGNLIIGDGVTTIGDDAFYSCTGFTGNLIIPNSVTNIGKRAFWDCCGLNGSLTLSNGLTTISENSFGLCSELSGELVIPDGVTKIEDEAFNCTWGITSLRFPISIKEIGTCAFSTGGYCVKDVWYAGTARQWEKIKIGEQNYSLEEATIHFSDGTTSQSVLEEPEETLVTEPTMETIPVTNPTEEPVPETTAETIPETTAETTAEAIPETTSESVEPETAQETGESIQGVSAMSWWRVPQGAKPEEGAAVPLSAHTGTETVKNGRRSVAFVGLEPGEEYVLIVSLRTGSVQPADLQYIEQSTADGNGKVSFTYIPRTDVSAITQLYGISAQRAITLDREYLSIPMGSLSEPIRAAVDPEEWADSLVWSSENEDIVSVDEQGYVTPVAPGTGYVLATVAHGKYTLTARCRVDVTEKAANEEVLGVDLGLTKVTSELYSRNYASLDVLLRLEQNEISAFSEENQVTDNGVAITGAFLEDEAARQIFDLKVKDDRHLLLVPTQAAIDGTVPVGKKVISRVVVEVNGVEYHTEDAVTVTVGKTLPKLKAQNVTFNSFYTDQSQALSITGGAVTKVENNGQWPDWLTLDGTKLTLNNAPAKGSASLNLLVSTEEWAVPVPVKVTAKLAYKAPAFRLSASRVTIPVFTKPDDNGDTAGAIWVQLMCKSKTDTLESLNVTGIRAPSGWNTETGENFTADGWFAIKPNPGTQVQAGKLALNVCFSDTRATVPVTVSVKPQAEPLTVRLYQPTVKYTLNSAVADGFFEPWYLGPQYVNNCQPIWSILDKSGQDVTANFETYWADDGRIAVLTDPKTAVPGNYRLCVDLERDGAVITEKTAVRNFTVLSATKKPGVTLKAGAPMDVSFPDAQTDVTFVRSNYFLNRFENYNELSDQARFYDAKGAEVQGRFEFAQNEETNQWYIRPVSEVPAGSYQMQLDLILDSDSASGVVPCTVKFTVKRTPIKLKLSQSKLSLNKAVMDSAVVDVTCQTKGYFLGQPVITAPAEITAEYRDGKLYLAVNDRTAYGASYTVTVKAAENQPEAVLTVMIPAQAASGVTVSAKASGFIDVIRDGSEIVVTPSYKNYCGLTAIDKAAKVFWAKDGKNFTEDVTAAFRLSWDEGGKLHLQRAGNLELTGKYRLELAVQGAQKPALVNLTLKSGTAKMTAAPVVLYAKDANTRAELKFTSQETGLNSIARVEARSGEYTIENLSYGGFAIRPVPGRTLKSGKVSVNLFFEGNTTAKPNATVTIPVEIR